MSSNCDLCSAEKITPWYFEDDSSWVAECEVCGVPMVVWKTHSPTPSPEIFTSLIDKLTEVANRVLGKDTYRIDSVMRQIPDHFHAHARRKLPFQFGR